MITLTERQHEVLLLALKGHTYDEMALKLGIGYSGIKHHMSNLLAKFGVKNRSAFGDVYFRAKSTIRIRKFIETFDYLPTSRRQA